MIFARRRRDARISAAAPSVLTSIEFDPTSATIPQNETRDFSQLLVGRDQYSNVMTIADTVTYSEVAPTFDIAAQSGFYDRWRASSAPGVHGDPVSTWTSVNARNLTSSLTLRPLKQIVSGVHSVLWDGSNDYMDVTGLAITNPYTMYWVMTPLNAGTFLRFFEALNGTANGAFLTFDSGPTFRLYGAGQGPSIAAAAAPVLGTKGIMTMVFGAAEKRLQWNTLTADTSGTLSGALAPNGLRLGADVTPAAYTNFHLYDLVVRLGADDATKRDSHRIALGWEHQVAA